MTGLRRFPILAIAALLVAGCGSNISSPGFESPGTTFAADTPAPLPTNPTITMVPAPSTIDGCPSIDTHIPTTSPHFTVWTPAGGSFLGLDVVELYPLGAPRLGVKLDIPEPYLDDPIRLVGGWRIGLDPADDMGEGIKLISATASFQTSRGQVAAEATIGVVPKTEREGFLFEVPDVVATRARFTVEWKDECFRYRAEKVWGLQMVRAAHAASCPTDADGFLAHWVSMGEAPITVGGLGTELSPDEMIGLWTSGATGSQGNDPLTWWDAASAGVIAAPGSVVPIVPASEDLDPISLSAEFHRRDAVKEWQSGSAARPRSVFSATADPYPDGHLDLLMPPDPGRYVVALRLVAQTPCLQVGAVGAASIDVE